MISDTPIVIAIGQQQHLNIKKMHRAGQLGAIPQ
jgi:hypothetical protein